MKRFAAILSWVLSLVALLAICGLLLLVAVHVGRRSLGMGGVIGTLEMIEVVLVVIGLAAIGHAQLFDAHVSSTVLVSRLPDRIRILLQAAWQVIAILLFGLFTYYTAERAWQSFMSREARFGIAAVPIWPTRVILPLAFGSLVVVLAVQFRETVQAFRRGSPEI